MTTEGDATYTPPYRQPPRCPICSQSLVVRLARGRKSGKPFVMLLCPEDARHFRAFINDQPYVRQVLDRLEGRKGPRSGGEL